MSLSAIAEPALVIFLLFGGTYLNRTDSAAPPISSCVETKNNELMNRAESGLADSAPDAQGWRYREVGLLGWRWKICTPDTHCFQDRFLSRVLRRFPFLLEVLYWALIYWV